MVRMQWVECPACGHGHTFSLPVGGPITRAYGYHCPRTGRPSAIGLRGQWAVAEHLSQSAIPLSPIGESAEAPTA